MLAFVLLNVFIGLRAANADLTIIDVRRNIPLSDSEKVYHDYLVDGGSEAGLKVGMKLFVLRRAPIYDYYRFRSVADLQLNVARVKVVSVQDGISVVRVADDVPRETFVAPDENFIMVGDKLDLAVVSAENAAPVADAAVSAAPAPGPQILVNSVVVESAPTPKAPAPVEAPAPAAPAPPK